MTVSPFGRVVLIHFGMIGLAGWAWTDGNEFAPASDPDLRVFVMRQGANALHDLTGLGFFCDLALWRALLTDPAGEQDFGYGHPYAASGVDRVVQAAIADPKQRDFEALAQDLGPSVPKHHPARTPPRDGHRGPYAVKDILPSRA